jgi:putative DNA primase/helicase
MNMKNRPTNLSLPAKVVLKYTSHIKITNFGRDLDGNLFVKLLVDQENIRKKFWISLGELSYSRRETYNTINRFGGHIISLAAQREFETRLQLSIPKNSDTLVVTKIGWVDNNFIMPYGVIGNKKRRIVVLLPSSSAKLVDKYICSGTVEGAKELMALAGGNSRFMLALSLAFLGPLADLAGQAQVAVQFFGVASSGKTGLSAGASSIYGWHINSNIASQRGFAESWNQTINYIEQLAVSHSNTFLILDEANTAPTVRNSRTQGILDCVFRLDQSQEKGRLYSPSRASWWMPVLSISNRSLEEMAIEEKIQFKDEARDRLIEIPLPNDSNSIFETLHGHKTAGNFVAAIKRLATLNHGVLGREYIRHLCEIKERDPMWLPEFIASRKIEYLSIVVKTI